MLDFSEILIIGGVSLVVLGPERLPKVARTVGSWVGRAQSYVSQMRGEFDREFHLSELRAMGEEARRSARDLESAVRVAVGDMQGEVNAAARAATGADGGWSSGPGEQAVFTRRYRPRANIDDVTAEIERLRRELGLSASGVGSPRRRLAPRARVSRVRVRR
jgi:sec-independent protein translocase protein TatB